jgi:hypothetical protein
MNTRAMSRLHKQTVKFLLQLTYYTCFFNSYSGGWSPIASTRPRVIMMEKLVEWVAGETEVLGEILLHCRFVHHKPHMLPGREPGPPRWEVRA